MAERLWEKRAIITGAARGIGRAIALKFAEEGARVVLCDLIPASVAALADKIKEARGLALAQAANVASREEVEQLFQAAVKEFERIDILVNCAGVRRDAPFETMSDVEWNAVMEVHLRGGFYCCQTAQKYMIPQNYGKIVNLASPIPSGLWARGQANYAAANAGVFGLTQALALELGRYNINVNCLAPDFIDTEMTREAARRHGFYLEELTRAAVAQIPLRRLGKPEDVANAAVFLASDEASFISGQILQVKGGP